MPKTDNDWQVIVRNWVFGYTKKYLSDFEGNMSELCKKMFLVQWRETRSFQNPDIEGALLNSIMGSSKTFECDCCNKDLPPWTYLF